MHTWHASVWTVDGCYSLDLITEAESIGEAAANYHADTEHLTVVELNIRRGDR